MLSPLIRRPRKNESKDANSKQRGVTLALVAASLVALIAMAALSIDVGTLYQAKAEAQRAADAGALTAARVISISGITGDPNNTSGLWEGVCGAGGTATLAAQAVAQSPSNFVGGAAPTAKVNYGTGAGVGDCAPLAGSSFSVNPIVTVNVQQAKLPTFFARVFSLTGGASSNSGVSATATAEAFNPSGSEAYGGSLIPVQPRCVKPWIVPNKDPGNGSNQFVTLADGSIVNPGIFPGKGVIGETFNLAADCNAAPGACAPLPNPAPGVNPAGTLQYLPGLPPAASSAVPSCVDANPYQQAIAGCDQATQYQCGVPSAAAANPNLVDVNENPSGGAGDTSTAAQCLIYQAPGAGQDSLIQTTFPYQIQAGAGNPLKAGGTEVTSSTSIVSLPIYDSSVPLTFTGTQAKVTIVGFLQVFINNVDVATGNPRVTVLNVAGCGNGTTNTVNPLPLYGTSPVPIRLITPP
jgi:Flp pilus assembly protein TadG